jgi:hypothetical protein
MMTSPRQAHVLKVSFLMKVGLRLSVEVLCLLHHKFITAIFCSVTASRVLCVVCPLSIMCPLLHADLLPQECVYKAVFLVEIGCLGCCSLTVVVSSGSVILAFRRHVIILWHVDQVLQNLPQGKEIMNNKTSS